MEQSLVSFKYHIALALDVNVYTCTSNSTLDQFPGFEIREGKLFGHFITRILDYYSQHQDGRPGCQAFLRLALYCHHVIARWTHICHLPRFRVKFQAHPTLSGPLAAFPRDHYMTQSALSLLLGRIRH